MLIGNGLVDGDMAGEIFRAGDSLEKADFESDAFNRASEFAVEVAEDDSVDAVPVDAVTARGTGE